jgi:hypothetical protein
MTERASALPFPRSEPQASGEIHEARARPSTQPESKLIPRSEPQRVAETLRADPQRWSHPVPHEPLFAIAEARGFAWSGGNAAGVATLRHATETGSTRGVMKLDWFLAAASRRVRRASSTRSARRAARCSPITKRSRSRCTADALPGFPAHASHGDLLRLWGIGAK